jgi:signal transduction histidine kinase
MSAAQYEAVGAIATSPTHLQPKELVEVLAHDLRQPLSTIEAIACYLDLILSRDDHRAREQVSKLHVLLEQMNWMIGNGTFALRDLQPAVQVSDLDELISHAMAARPAPELTREFRGGSEPALVRLDPAFAYPAIQSALQLAGAIAGERGLLQISTNSESGCILLSLRAMPGEAWQGNLPPGAMLSLACIRKFAESHGGELLVHLSPGSHAELLVRLPAA